MERKSSGGGTGKRSLGADGGGLGGTAKSGGRDRTPTKGHYMKVMLYTSFSIVTVVLRNLFSNMRYFPRATNKSTRQNSQAGQAAVQPVTCRNVVSYQCEFAAFP